jgi:chromosome partitioning protein
MLGVSPSLVNMRVREMESTHPVGLNKTGKQRLYYPQDIRALCRMLEKYDEDRAAERVPETTPTQVVAVCNQKGGVGKTTTTVTFAQNAAIRGKRVLLIDLDPQASTTASFLIESDAGSGRLVEGTHADLSIDSTVCPVLMGEEGDPRKLIRKTHWETIDLIPSCPDLIEAEFSMIRALMDADRTGTRPAFWTALRAALRGITVSEYDLIIIDTPPAMNLTSIAVSLASHGLLIPIPPRNLDIESLRAFIRTTNSWLAQLATTMKFELKWIRFLTTMMRADSHAEMRNDILLRQRLAQQFVPDLVPRMEALQRASGGAPSIFELQPESLSSAQKSAAAARRTIHRVYAPVFDLIQATYREMA